MKRDDGAVFLLVETFDDRPNFQRSWKILTIVENSHYFRHSSLCQALSTPLLSTGEPDTIPANLPGLIRLAKGVLQAPVLVLLGCPRAKLIAPLGCLSTLINRDPNTKLSPHTGLTRWKKAHRNARFHTSRCPREKLIVPLGPTGHPDQPGAKKMPQKCRKLPRIADNCHKLPKMPKNAEKFQQMPKNAEKSRKMSKNPNKCRKRPKIAKDCQKLPKIPKNAEKFQKFPKNADQSRCRLDQDLLSK